MAQSISFYSGMKIGALTITSGLLYKEREDAPGEYTHNAEYITAQCNCGQDMELWCDELPSSKKVMLLKIPDCGCGAYRAQQEKSSLPKSPTRRKERRTGITAYVGIEISVWLDARAKKENRTFSSVVNDILELGIMAQTGIDGN